MVKNQNSKKNSTAPGWFQFSLLSASLYLLISLVMLSLLNFHAVWQTLLQSLTGSTDQTALEPYTENLLNFMGRLDTPVLMLFWAGFGVMVFAVIWVIQNAIFTVGKEVEESHYLKGGAPVRGYWQKAMKSNLWLAFSVILWLSYAALYISFLLPLASKMFFVGLNDTYLGTQFSDCLGAVFINAAGLYLFWNVHLILTYTWRTVR